MPDMTSYPPPEFALFLFGPFHLEARGEGTNRTIRLPRRKVENLLAYLAVYPEPHSREKLATLFWGDTSDEQARTSLRTALVVLRKTLTAAALLTDREQVQLNPAFSLWVDVRQFRQTRSTSPETAITLYTDEFLPTLYDEWVLAEREQLRRFYSESLLALTQQMRSQSEYARAIGYARQLLALDITQETAHQHIMFCELARGNRAAALDQYDRCVHALHDELGVSPAPETQALYHWIKQTSLAPSDAARLTNLPIPLTSFVGRRAELAQVRAILPTTRLLTLTGAGGSGKTRLSIQVAMDLLNQFRHGVWWVDLAGVMLPSLVPQTVAKALGVSEKPQQTLLETITAFLRPRHILLILDNCEHLIEASAELAASLLGECPHLQMMTTSREPLGIGGELVWRVPPLAVPEQDLSRETLLLMVESVSLFVERARAVRPEFALTEHNLAAVLQICRRLDGIPLAIELAAARISALSAHEIAARLDNRFDLLTHGSRTALPRQQTLRALVDWSYDLLAPEERLLFQRLSVFSGGRTLAAIESTCGFAPLHPSQILHWLTRLIAKSLLIAEYTTDENETRYTFLATIKQYAAEKLEQAGETTVMGQRHLDYFLNLAETNQAALDSLRHIVTLKQLESEHDNCREALRFALQQPKRHEALRLVNALTEFWDVRGYIGEGRNWLQRAIALYQAGDVPEAESVVYGYAQLNAGKLAVRQSDLAAALSLAQSSLTLLQRLGDKAGIAQVYLLLGSVARMKSEWAVAQQWGEEALALLREQSNKQGLLLALRHLGALAESQSNYAEARRLHEASLEMARELGAPGAIARSLSQLGSLAQQQGQYEQARTLYEQILAVYRQMGARWHMAATLSNMGNLAHSQGDFVTARQQHEEGLALMRAIGDKRGIAIVLNNLGNATLSLHDFPAARKLHEESLRLRRELGDRRGVALALSNLGDVAVGMGDYDEAQGFYAAALPDLHELGDKRTLAHCLIAAADVATLKQRFALATTLAGAIHTLLANLDAQIDVRERGRYEHAQTLCRTHLDENTFHTAWHTGLALTLEQTIALAITPIA
ncbi:MAG: tetratricopeptide repeat protein [Chloroflexi bacterium]|nr:tetratricopeptide repeat protein [Chloroflexota bacterium]